MEEVNLAIFVEVISLALSGTADFILTKIW